MQFRTISGSTYEIDTQHNRVRRLFGARTGTPRQSADGQWQIYESVNEITVGESVIFVWGDNPDGTKRCTITSTVDELDTILINQAKCGGCGDVIVSINRHDYVTCSCGALSVDGGRDYIRRNYTNTTPWEELSVYAVTPAREQILLENSDKVLTNVHAATTCSGAYCTIHKRSDHPMRGLEQTWAGGRMWRICSHEVLHPDPDDYVLTRNAGLYEHQCCTTQCCSGAYPAPIS
jgi:hypothetical protein